MSKQITIHGFISAVPAKSWSRGDANVIDGMVFDFWGFKPSETDGRINVCEHTLTFDLPEDFDPRPKQIEALEAMKAKLQAKFSASVLEINRQISQLQAICYDSEAA